VIAVPAWLWRTGALSRASIIGAGTGIVLGALVFAESGSAPGAAVAGVVLAVFCGIAVSRRMARFWPGAKDLGDADRVAVVAAARSGADIGDPRLASAVIDYGRGLRDAAHRTQRFGWVVPAVTALALVLAVGDSIFGPLRTALVSWLFVAILLAELLWWRRRQTRLLRNAQRATALARALCPPARRQ